MYLKLLCHFTGIVTPVRHQKSCGSCAAFATGGAMETCLMKGGASLTDLDISEQQLVDCAYGSDGANGCDGAYISSYPKFIEGMHQFQICRFFHHKLVNVFRQF